MATAPVWFNAQTYFANKATAMNMDSTQLKAAFAAAGYNSDSADSLYDHFNAYGAHEGTSPDSLFSNEQYLYSKSVAYYQAQGLQGATVSPNQTDSMTRMIKAAGFSPWEHYSQWGWNEKDSQGNYLNNPSAGFNTNEYMKSKLAQLQSGTETVNGHTGAAITMADLELALKDGGLNPLTHYYEYGQGEGIQLKAAPYGQNFNLTKANDPIHGTEGNDYIISKVGMLNSESFIDGQGGTDTVYAYVGDGNGRAVSPEMWSVEKVIFRAQHETTQSGTNNPALNMNVNIDAGDIHGMTYLKDDNSRSNLVVEDVRTNSNKMTISWADSDPGQVDFKVYFDSQHLKAQEAAVTGVLSLKVMDVKNADVRTTTDGPDGATTIHPLMDSPYTKFVFNYTDLAGNSTKIELDLGATTTVPNAGVRGLDATYDTLLTAFQVALETAGYKGIISASLGDSWQGTTNDGTNSFSSAADTGKLIVLSAGSLGSVWVTPDASDGSGWIPTMPVPAQSALIANAETDRDISCPLIQTNVHLDNVARVQWNDGSDCLPANDDYGSEAGDMVIGSMATRGGVERFDVKVDRGSWLSSLSSTNNVLRMVTVENLDTNGDGINGNIAGQASSNAGATGTEAGQLYIGDSMQPNGTPNLIAWQDAPKLLATNGLVDVKYFEAGQTDDKAAFQGELNIGASITAAAYGKYLKDVDGLNTVYSMYAPDGDFKYNLGNNNDTINMTVNGGIAADQDFKLLINGNAGADFINFAFEPNMTNNQLANIRQGMFTPGHERVILNGGADNDIIKFWGDGAVVAQGGAGNDLILVGQIANAHSNHTGAPQPGNPSDLSNPHNAVWVMNVNAPGATSVLDRMIYWDDVKGAQPLDNDLNGGLTTFSLTNGAASGNLEVMVNFRGIWAKAQVATTTAPTVAAPNATITAEQINIAIANAIANSPELSNLFAVKDGAGHSLMIEALYNDLMAAGDLSISFNVVTSPTASTPATWVAAAAADTFYNTNMNFAVEALPAGTATINATDGIATITNLDPGVTHGTPLTANDIMSVTINGVQYTATALVASPDDTGVVSSLVSARDSDGHRLIDKYNVADGAAGDGTITIAARDGSAITSVDLYRLDTTAQTDPAVLALHQIDGHTVAGGTKSNSWVEGGTGDDVIVLNANFNDAMFYDRLVLNGSFGHDTIFNFSNGTALLPSIDQIGVKGLLAPTATAIAAGAIGTVGSVNVGTANAAAANHWFTTAEFITANGAAYTTAGTSVVFMQDTTAVAGENPNLNVYTVFQVNADATAGLTANEVVLLGTLTFEAGTLHAIDPATQFVFA